MLRTVCLLFLTANLFASTTTPSTNEVKEAKESHAPKTETHKADAPKTEAPKAPAVEEKLAAPQPAAHGDNHVESARKASAPEVKDPAEANLELVRTLRFQRSFELAEKQAHDLVTEDNSPEIRRQATLELAYIAQDSLQLARAQEIFSEYLRKYPKDPSAPEICLRQGLVFRQMGAHQQALARFYQVMNYALSLKLDKFEYYQGLVLKAKTEIAETYYQQGKFTDAADYFTRLLKAEEKGLDRPVCLFKLIRSLSAQEAHEKVVAQGQSFIDLYPESLDIPEVRFMLADSLKKLNRNRESMQQVLALLQSQQKQAAAHPEIWAHWQQRTGNQIANELYKEGDFMSALEIYLSLSKLSASPTWQAPVWYQIALVYEHLKQTGKAVEYYEMILKRQDEIRKDSPTPGLLALLDMAQWRHGYLGWGERTDKALQKLNLPPVIAPADEAKHEEAKVTAAPAKDASN